MIPSLNERENLGNLLPFLQKFPCEVIVVEAGNTGYYDFGAKVTSSPKGRAIQMNRGAALATGEILFFLHADSILPDSWYNDILQSLEEKHWGGFRVKFSRPGAVFATIAFFMNLRSCLTGIITGDMGLFIRKQDFFKSGGFAEIPLMEDIEISIRLKKKSLPDCLDSRIIISPRKWEKEGIIFTILKMWMIRLLYFGGASPERLHRIYYG